MPHVIIKFYPGKSEAQKRDLSDAIVREVTQILSYGEDAVSVGFEEVGPADWSAQAYGPDIQDRWSTLTKTPGYGPGERTKEGAQ